MGVCQVLKKVRMDLPTKWARLTIEKTAMRRVSAQPKVHRLSPNL